ncbi:MAG: hypothetical protein CVV11_09565 [Gammaproteobacteria bacterium HGW-Gammaproteobacteria-15]|nr:MAG: hypothetical protein CVV11_09565 [Gammaproteobacteria bacterium HGW-Gammaproteobacteria-15]
MKVFDLKAYEEKIDRIIAQSFSASLMSNAKWRKLFSEISKSGFAKPSMKLKRVSREDAYNTYRPELEDIEELWVAEGKNDCNYFYKEIEWVELFGSSSEINSVLAKIGQFKCFDTELGVLVYGHEI